MLNNTTATIHQQPEAPTADETLYDIAGMTAWLLDIAERIELEVNGLAHEVEAIGERLAALELANRERAAADQAALEALTRLEAMRGGAR